MNRNGLNTTITITNTAFILKVNDIFKFWLFGWKPSYDEHNASYFVINAKRHQHAILLAVNESDPLFWKDILTFIVNTIDFIQQALKKTSILRLFLSWLCGKFAYCLISERSLRLKKKVKNIHDAFIGIFPSIFFPDLPIDQFTPSFVFAQQLHRKIGNELIRNAGRYRTRHVMATQENYVYMAPDLIEDKMDELFRQCREEFEKTDLQLEEAIKCGACFFFLFLDNSPFCKWKRKSREIAFKLPFIKIHSCTSFFIHWIWTTRFIFTMSPWSTVSRTI